MLEKRVRPKYDSELRKREGIMRHTHVAAALITISMALAAGAAWDSTAANAVFPDVVVSPPAPPAGPIPIPYPNTHIPPAKQSAALSAFTIAQSATQGVIAIIRESPEVD